MPVQGHCACMTSCVPGTAMRVYVPCSQAPCTHAGTLFAASQHHAYHVLLLCRPGPNGDLQLVIRLPPDEASDVMNFVLKDDATNTW